MRISRDLLRIPGRPLAVVIMLLCVASAAGAQTPEPQSPPPAVAPPATNDSVWDSIKFGATLEGYYQYTWNRPPDRTVALRAYDTRANSFSIQQAALVIDSPPV